jgi:hypothetical protein
LSTLLRSFAIFCIVTKSCYVCKGNDWMVCHGDRASRGPILVISPCRERYSPLTECYIENSALVMLSRDREEEELVLASGGAKLRMFQRLN